jgi:hypothetical protein
MGSCRPIEIPTLVFATANLAIQSQGLIPSQKVRLNVDATR